MWRWFIGLILIALGLSALFEINLLKFIVPVALIWVGWMIISKDKTHLRTSDEQQVELDNLNEVYIFSGARKKIKSTNFADGNIVAVFGGLEIDLSEVKTKAKTIKLETVAVCGGIRIRIPKNWEVDAADMTAVLGGFDKATDAQVKKEVKLIVSGATVFGGVEIYA